MTKRAKKPAFEDDGRVIAPMNIDGMPWYNPKKERDRANEGSSAPVTLSRRDKLAFAFGVLKAVLLAASVFIGALLAFILFCTEVWFR